MNFSAHIAIQGRRIGPDEPLWVIAEAGINHNGRLGLAMDLIRAAKASGADAIKFQAFSTPHCESRFALKPDYFHGRDRGQSKHDFSKNLEFDKSQFRELKACCDEVGIVFFSMAADAPSLELLVDIGCPAIKIGSSDTLNYPLFKDIGSTGLPVIYSTGISTWDEVARGVAYLRDCGVAELALLQCTSQYPASPESIGLGVIDRYREAFGVPVGLSDHSQGLHMALAAAARGSNIIEKHFTLDRTFEGVDHAASIEPAELATMVRQIREVESAIGTGEKQVHPSESGHLATMRKSLFSMCAIEKGQTIQSGQIAAKRPGGGILPTEIDRIIGCRAKRDIPEDEFITWEMIEGEA